MKLTQALSSKSFLVLFLSFSILIGSGYNTYLSYERFYNPDSETYMNIAKGNFADQSLIRKYRVIVPFLANIAACPIEAVYYKIVRDKRDTYDWPLLTGFFLVNSLLLAFAALFIFKIMEFQGTGKLAAAIGLGAFLAGGRWAGYVAAHPVTDSLTILSIAVMMYGLLKQNSYLLATGIIAGLLSKESCALFFPMLVLFSDKKSRIPVILSIAIAFGLYFGVKYLIDSSTATSAKASLDEAFDTINSIKISLVKLFSVKGMADVFSVYGFFSLLFISGLFFKRFRTGIKKSFSLVFIVFALTIFGHMLLSTELARMFYLGSALFVPFLARCFEIHPLFESMAKARERS